MDNKAKSIYFSENNSYSDDSDSEGESLANINTNSYLLEEKKMSCLENNCFPHISQAAEDIQETYLSIRNKILSLWFCNPREELVFENVCAQLQYHDSINKELAYKIYEFLEIYGFINFGIFEKIKDMPLPAQKIKVTVVGAGIAGLSAAQHLKRFGAEVLVIEGRDRVGGRIYTYHKHPFFADLGGMIVPGDNKNLLPVILKQVNLDIVKLNDECQLYEADGTQVSLEKEVTLSTRFFLLLECAKYICKELQSDNTFHKKISLDETLEMAICLKEKEVKENLIKYLKKIVKLQNKLAINQLNMFSIQENIMKYSKDYKDYSGTELDIVEEFKFRVAQREIRQNVKEWDEFKKQEKYLENKLQDMEANKPCEIYLSYNDRNILDWHAAYLEYLNSSPLNKLSADQWYQNCGMSSSEQLCVSKGLSQVTESFAQHLTINLNTAVKEIHFMGEKAIVIATDLKTGEVITIQSDVVLCTLPLGILKQSVDESNVSGTNKPQFIPRLPEWKVTAINQLNFGGMNKVILCFSSIFWREDVNFFGYIESSKESRGEFFLFANVTKSPVLIASISGSSVQSLETVSDDILIKRCMFILKCIFKKKVTTLKESKVVRWLSDQWCMGSFSSIGVDACMIDYDILAKPLGAEESSPKLYFAGEHTIRECPGTVHGAMISGLREAGLIISTYLK